MVDAVDLYLDLETPEMPEEPAWPLLIPEISCITETTSRIGVWPDEGDWRNPFWNPVAWDMTAYLFDKVRGASWVFEPENHDEQDWHDFLGPEKNWIHNILLVDRLPDWLALQVPPTSIMVAYLNRLMTFHRRMLYDQDAPQPWLVTHGYPSYIDWPPAWHFNLGIRMLSSLLEYVSSLSPGMMLVERGAFYPDKNRRTSQELPLPFIHTDDGNRLLWTPGSTSHGPTEMEWPRTPGIIPFLPGADMKQVTWFGRQMVRAGFGTFALDALNTIAHENFEGLQNAITSLHSIGVNRTLVYGPWPLHIPANYRGVRDVSYIASANHIDLTDYPSRFWRYHPEVQEKEATPWRKMPSYKSTSMSSVESMTWIDTCDCRACMSAKLLEPNPRGIWRLGHLMNAGLEWMLKVQDQGRGKETQIPTGNERLWYSGPSYAVFRDCLHHSGKVCCDDDRRLVDTLRFSETDMVVGFPDGLTLPQSAVRWCRNEDFHEWAREFPSLGG